MPISAPKKVIDQEGRSNRVDVGTSKLHFFLILKRKQICWTRTGLKAEKTVELL